MARLVAIRLRGGPDFVAAVESVWEAGDAVFPVDPDAPDDYVASLLQSMGAAELRDQHGSSSLDHGRPIEPGDALVVATSGTTASPRGAVLTHEAVRAAAFASATGLGVHPGAKWLACLPLHHVGGFGVVARSLVTGTPVEVHDGFDASRVEAAARSGCTHTSLVPTTLARIDAGLFHTILLGGSALPDERPANTVATYGMTETCGGVVYNGWPLNGVGLRITDDDEIHLSGETLLRTYRDGHDPKLPDGWYPTGDLGSVDPATGRLTVWGRADDVIVTGGEKVWPDTVEEILVAHPQIAEAAVIGRPDPEWGERVVAVVVPSGHRLPDLAELQDLVRARLPRHHAPKAIEPVETIPRTGIGKPRRAMLRSQ